MYVIASWGGDIKMDWTGSWLVIDESYVNPISAELLWRKTKYIYMSSLNEKVT